MAAADLIQPSPGGVPGARDLPAYCFRIAAILRKTHLGIIAGVSDVFRCDRKALQACKTWEEAKQVVEIDWRAYGRWLGVLESGVGLIENGGLDSALGKLLAAIPEKEAVTLLQLVFGFDAAFAACVLAPASADVPPELQARLAAAVEAYASWKRVIANGQALARRWDLQAVAETHVGMAEGALGIINGDLEPTRGTTRQHTYAFLAMIWPEVGEMQASNPPKSRADLHLWLQPFVADSLVNLGDFGHFCDVCDELGLTLKGRGRPRKAQ